MLWAGGESMVFKIAFHRPYPQDRVYIYCTYMLIDMISNDAHVSWGEHTHFGRVEELASITAASIISFELGFLELPF